MKKMNLGSGPRNVRPGASNPNRLATLRKILVANVPAMANDPKLNAMIMSVLSLEPPTTATKRLKVTFEELETYILKRGSAFYERRALKDLLTVLDGLVIYKEHYNMTQAADIDSYIAQQKAEFMEKARRLSKMHSGKTRNK